MIAQLTGKLVHKTPQLIVIDVGGVGYSIVASLTTFSALPEEGEPVTLMVHTYVREDALTLYGFTSSAEKAMFQRLIAVSGVGPKVALAILSGIPPDHLVAAITAEDKARLNAIPGVGRKTAERIIIDLKDKISREPIALGIPAQQKSAPLYDDTLSALVNLGYSKPVAERALTKLDWSAAASLETAIRDALKELVPQ